MAKPIVKTGLPMLINIINKFMGKEQLKSEKFYRDNFVLPADLIDKKWMLELKTKKQMEVLFNVARLCFEEGLRIGKALQKRKNGKQFSEDEKNLIAVIRETCEQSKEQGMSSGDTLDFLLFDEGFRDKVYKAMEM